MWKGRKEICELSNLHSLGVFFLQIPEEVGIRCGSRITLGLDGPGQEAWEHGRAWPDSLGVCGKWRGGGYQRVGWGARVGGGHAPLPAAAGPLGLPLPGLLRADRSVFCARRDVSRRCRLPPGHYLVVPSASRVGDEADFTLRIFSERSHTAV